MLILNHASGQRQGRVASAHDNMLAPGPRCRAVPSTTDKFGFTHASTNAAASAAFERAVFAVAAHKPAAAAAIAEAIDEDPDLVAAHALQGFAHVMLGRAELVLPARRALQAARRLWRPETERPMSRSWCRVSRRQSRGVSRGLRSGSKSGWIGARLHS